MKSITNLDLNKEYSEEDLMSLIDFISEGFILKISKKYFSFEAGSEITNEEVLELFKNRII